jgi:diguanylate cyclase (GGDEF)-like protein
MHEAPPVLSVATAGLRRLLDRMTLRQQVGVATSILCFLIVAAVAIGAAVVGERAVRLASEKKMSEIAFSVADRLSRGAVARLRTLDLLGQIEPLRATWVGDAASARHILDQGLRAIPYAVWLGFATSDGTVRAGSGGFLEGHSVAEEPWFQSRIQGRKVIDVYSFEPLARLLPNDASGEPRRFVVLAVRVEDSHGRMFGILTALLDWRSWTHDAVDVILKDRNETVGTRIWILSEDGRALLGPATDGEALLPEEHARTRGVFRGAYSSEGIGGPTVTGFAHTDGELGWGWSVFSRQSATIGFGVADSVVWTIVAIGLIVGVFGLGAAIMVAGRIARPIRDLADKADRLGRDDTNMLPRMRGSREVVQLSSALRSLILRLGSAEQSREEAELRAAEEARRHSHDIETLRAMAHTDGLTTLLNRRGFMTFAAEAMDAFGRDTREFAILMIDLDHFKSINDTHGHAVGDRVIHRVASIVSTAVRPTDRVGRFGGEEFIVLLHDATADGAETTAERIRGAVAAESVAVDEGSISINITLSIGIATARETDRDVQDVIERADLALYAAKNSGRNAVAAAPVKALVPQRRAG